MSPCPVVLTFEITIYLKEYHPGGVPRYGITGTTESGQVLFAEFDDATCTALFSVSQAGGPDFGCIGTVSETHHEMFGSGSKGTPPHEGQSFGWLCDVSPPIEPNVEFLPP